MDTRSLLDNYSCEATPPQSEMGITSENGYTMASKGGGLRCQIGHMLLWCMSYWLTKM